jgi:outer membrane protein
MCTELRPDHMSQARPVRVRARCVWKECRQLLALYISLTLLPFLLPLTASGETITVGEALTLQRAIDIALKNQPSILAGQSTVKANEAKIGGAKANYYPQIAASGAYSRTSPATEGGRTAGSSGASSGTYDQYTSSLGLSQMVFDFGKTPTQVRISDLNTESSRFDLRNVQDTVTLNVKQAYYNLLQAQRNTDVAKDSVKQFQEHLEQARGFYEVGTKPKFDVTKAEVDLSNSRLNLIKAENQMRLGRVTLNNAMGIPDAPQYHLVDSLSYTNYELAFEQALQKAYTQRADLQSITKKREAAKASIDLAYKGYVPVVTGNASYYYSATDFPLAHGWTYGLNFSVPLFSGFLTRQQVAEAQANYNTLNYNEQSLRQDIYSQVEQAYIALREAGERIGVSELAVRQARENQELAVGRYQAGVGSPIEVTDALVALNNAEVAYTAALTDYKNAQASIEKAIGVRE